jgi:hypothetical protein
VRSTTRWLRDFVLDVAQTLLRALPWPTEPGLIRVGNPGRDAPVLGTCNYDLTVRRVFRALRGLDVYLLVAPTRGINVWCSAAGGYFTAHQVISILRTSQVDKLVDHRRLILPQLSATGVERKLVEQRTGWRAVFGPVYSADLPSYLASGRKSEIMRQVRFPLFDRLELAAAWAFSISVVHEHRSHFQQASLHGSKVPLHVLQTDVTVVNLLAAHLIFGHVTGDDVAAREFQSPFDGRFILDQSQHPGLKPEFNQTY